MRPRGRRASGVLLGGLLHGAVACQFPSYQLDQSSNGAGGQVGAAAGIGGGGSTAERGGAGQGAAVGTSGASSAGEGGAAREPSAPKPVAIQVDTTTEVALRESTTTIGTESNDFCPSPQLLIGVQGSTADPVDVVRSVKGVCGEPSIVENTTTGKYEVELVPGSLLTERGPGGDLAQTAVCPANQLVIGFNARAGAVMDGLEFRCASLQIVGASPDFELVVRTEGSAGALGGQGGSGLSYAPCSAGRVAIGQFTRMNDAAAAYGLHCAALSLTVR